MYIKNFFGHLKTVTKHRWWVFYYCCKVGIPFRGLIHDISKFSPTEFFESVKYYNGKKSPIDVCKEKNGMSRAWLHHKGRNKHHYEYWQDDFDHGGKCLSMPDKYAKEMLCDFLGAGRAYMGKNFSYKAEYEWWRKKLASTTMCMHKNQKIFITLALSTLACDYTNKNKNFKSYVNNALSDSLNTDESILLGVLNNE